MLDFDRPRDCFSSRTLPVLAGHNRVAALRRSRFGVLMVTLIVTIAWTRDAAGQDFWVNGQSGSDVHGDGSPGAPWRTVTYGLARVPFNATLNVAPGLYNASHGEGPLLTVPSGVTLRGGGSWSTRLESTLRIDDPQEDPAIHGLTFTGFEVDCEGGTFGFELGHCLVDLEFDWARFTVRQGGHLKPDVHSTRFQGRSTKVVVIDADEGSIFGGSVRNGFFYLGLDGAHIVSVRLSAGSRMETSFVGNIFEAKQHQGLAFWIGYGDYLPRNVSASYFLNNTFLVDSFHFSIEMDHDIVLVNNILASGCDYWLLESDQVWHNLLAPGDPFIGQNGNIEGDPAYWDPRNDFRLLESSVAIDAGMDAPDLPLADARGAPRVLDGDLDGELRPDIGAFEFTHAEIEVLGEFRLGGNLRIEGQGRPPHFGFLYFGFASGVLDFDRFGVMLLEPFSLGHPFSLGTLPADYSTSIPEDSRLVDVELFFQLLAYDPIHGCGTLSNRTLIRIRAD